MTDSKRNMLFTALNMAYGQNSIAVKNTIREESKNGANHERTFFQASTLIAARCSSFLQAQKIVREWVSV